MRDNTPKKGDLSKQEVYCAFLSVISRLQMPPTLSGIPLDESAGIEAILGHDFGPHCPWVISLGGGTSGGGQRLADFIEGNARDNMRSQGVAQRTHTAHRL